MKKFIIAMSALFMMATTNVSAQQVQQAQQTQQQAQNEKKAKDFLDKVAQKYQNDLSANKGIELTYEISKFQNRQAGGTNKGTLKMKNNKFFINANGIMVWYDGKVFTQRLEVNNQAQVSIMSNPKKSEIDTKNPYAFLTLYKKGYKLDIDENVTFQGVACKEVHFTSKQSMADIQEMYVAFDPNLNPLSVRLRQGKYTWIRIRVSNFKTGLSFPDTTFQYDEVAGEKNGDDIVRY